MNNLKIVMYHYVRDLKNSRYPKIKGLDYELFKQQIAYFEKYYHVVTMEEVIAAYNESYVLPKNALLLTFDDGYIDNYLFAYPVLKAHHMQGSFFVSGKTFTENSILDVNKIHFILASTPIEILIQDLFLYLNEYRGVEYDYPSNDDLFAEYAIGNRFDSKEVIFFKRILQMALPERLRNEITDKIFKVRIGISEEVFSKEIYMNYEQIKCMKDGGMHIGCHGYDHYWLNKLTREEFEKDITKGLECLEGLYNPDAWVMNYPYGSYSDEVIDYISKIGCKIGLSTDVASCCADSNKYKLPRLDTNDFPPKSNNFEKYNII